MAKILDLQATVRSAVGNNSVGRLRKAGRIPAVIYGKKHSNKSLEVDSKTFNLLLAGSASDNILVNLKIEGEAAQSLALVQEIQHDYLRGGILHIDFHAVAADEDMHADVPIILSGVDAAEKKGGKIEFVIRDLEVHCLPKDLPESFHVDVAHLEIDDAVHVRDLKLPTGVSTKIHGELVVAILKEPKVIEEVVPVAAAPVAGAPGAAPAAGAAAPGAAGAAPAAAGAAPAAGAKAGAAPAAGAKAAPAKK
jgi:large subunit ribosomal protein L25